MDILDLIKKYHRQVESLFSEIESTDDIQQLYYCFNKLCEEISLHAQVEERTFYPALRKHEDTNTLVNEAQEEYDTAKQLLEKIESFSPTSIEFKQKISQLKEVVLHHIQVEEDNVFFQARKYMNVAEREQLGREFTAVKNQLQNEISVVN